MQFPKSLRNTGDNQSAFETKVFDEVRNLRTQQLEAAEHAGTLDVLEWERIAHKKIEQETAKAEVDKCLDILASDMDKLQSDNAILRKEIEALKQANRTLTSRCETLTAALEKEPDCRDKLIAEASIKKFFDAEQYDVVVSALMLYRKSSSDGTRAAEVSDALIEANPLNGEGKALFEKIKRILKASPEINASAESQLREIGWTIDRSTAGHSEGKYKSFSHNFQLSNSPGSKDTADAKVNQIKKWLNIYKE
ncbi:MAG: hypothetical protein LBP79_00810 [Clostridiales bacterium]|jgi:hypothetical protein|nr:hypothetical protein [Clostridiales bacterium]